jgi:hypothetical protein
MSDTPAWFYGPNGAAEIFEDLADVPPGWKDHPSKVENTPAALEKAPAASQSLSGGTDVELDADGHPWSATIHAASKSKTSAGLWRMKVGATRPAPITRAPAPLDL